jgi:hypothetical protein
MGTAIPGKRKAIPHYGISHAPEGYEMGVPVRPGKPGCRKTVSVVAVYDVKPNLLQYPPQMKCCPESRAKAPHAEDPNAFSLGTHCQGRTPHREQFRDVTSASQTSDY